jgi:hypothetical protein
MSTSWTLLASEVCTDALQHLGVLGEDETANASQTQTALRGLDVVLKELPLAGYVWPKLSAEVALTWVAGDQTMALPDDYYGNPVAWRTDEGEKVPLVQISHAYWVQMLNREASGKPSHFYISPAGEFTMYPTPEATDDDPGVYLQYQRIVDDAELATTPDVLQIWKGALGYGVADEISMKVGAPKDRRVEVNQRWMMKKGLALQNSVSSEVISFEVRE